MPSVSRAPAWAPNAPIVFAYATDIAWVLDDDRHVDELESIVRAKWLGPDIEYPEVDARWTSAMLCALAGRPVDARAAFADTHPVLVERESVTLIPGVEFTAAEMELRLGAAGDREQFAACIAARRERCTHPTMAAWLPRLDDLEARAAELWPA